MLGQNIVIHASKDTGRKVRAGIVHCFPDARSVRVEIAGIPTITALYSGGLRTFPTGAVIGSGKLVNAGRIEEITIGGYIRVGWMRTIGTARDRNPYLDPESPGSMEPNEIRFGDWSVGRWIWEFAGTRLKAYPISARGRQRFWNWTPPKGRCG